MGWNYQYCNHFLFLLSPAIDGVESFSVQCTQRMNNKPNDLRADDETFSTCKYDVRIVRLHI